MHRTRLRQVVIDATADTFAATASFWADAIGATAERDDDEPEYAELRGHAGELAVLVQKLGEGTPARVHLDIESDDVEAEAARLTALGAEEVERIRSWVVMRDPAGLVFCVIRAQPGFDATTTTWP
jgi:predicted enzyme related to lactoylglutathione lyase